MKPRYQDILDAAGEHPQWWDGNGTPRFAPFAPDMLGVYDNVAVLAMIECAACRTVFLVGEGCPWMSVADGRVVATTTEACAVGSGYDDPPRHNCPGGGDTMISNDLAVIEVWERPIAGVWTRRRDLEGREPIQAWLDIHEGPQ